MSRLSSTLDAVLRRVHRRALRIATAALTLRRLALFLTALLTTVMLDAWVALSPVGLVVADLLLLGLVLVSTASACRVRRQYPYRPERIALLLHEQLELPPGRMIDAVDFALAAPPGASAALVEAAIRRGEELATTIDPVRAVAGTRVRRAARGAALAGLVCLALAATMPGLFHAVGRRLLHPCSDLPPFTRLTFAVMLSPDEIYVGQDADLRVRVTGPGLPDEASLVLLDAQGHKTRTPLWRDVTAADTIPDAMPTETLFSLRLEQLTTTSDFYIDTTGGRSSRQRLEVRRNPLIERVTLHFTPPAYTGWKPASETLGPAGLRALRRTHVAVRCRANVALGGGALILRPEKDAPTNAVSRIELTPDPAATGIVTGAFEMVCSGAFALEVTGADGLPGAKPAAGPLVCAPDLPPQIAIVEPDPVCVAPEDWKVPVHMEARDDVGLTELTLMTRIAQGPFLAQTMGAESAGHPMARDAAHTLDLGGLGARAGDQVRYFAIARDNEPEEGKTAETPVHTLLVVTMEAYRDMARAGYQMDHLKEEWEHFLSRINALAAERGETLRLLAEWEQRRKEQDGMTPADRARMQHLENALRHYQEQLHTVATAMRQRTETLDLYEVESLYKERLRALASQLDRQADDAANMERALAGVPMENGTPPDVDAAAARLRANTAPFEAHPTDTQFAGELDTIAKAARLGFLASRLQSVIERQRDLADRLSTANPADGLPADRPRLETLGREQRGLEKELRETVDALERTGAECRQTLPRMSASAAQWAAAVRELAAWDDQAAAADACPNRPSTAAERAETAARKLDTLLSDCQSAGGGLSDELDGCLSLCKNPGAASVQQMIQSLQTSMHMGLAGQNGMGGGAAGTMATVGLVGPRLPTQANSMSAGGGESGATAGRAGKTLSRAKEAAPADAIQTESTLDNATAARPIPGVPQAYRDLAEAYFRRLARDAADRGRALDADPVEEKRP